MYSQFKPAWWLTNPHAQTLWAAFMRRKAKPDLQWQRLELDDGDFIDLAWCSPAEFDKSCGKTILILHGLEGSVHSKYALGLMSRLQQKGYRCCLMHLRNCSDEPNRLPESYHSGKTSDVQLVTDILAQQMDIRFYAAIGFSLGGNVLLKWLGEQGDNIPLQRAAVMSVPFQLAQAAERMNHGFSKIYQSYLVGKMQRSYKTKFARIASPLHVDAEQLNSFWTFDDQVTAPLHGFKDVHDYYQQASSRQYIPKIKIPTLILHAKDDPFMYPQTAPTADELPDNVWLELTSHGGHVGFVSGSIPGWGYYWGEQRLVEWIDQIF
jgi:predicted alpha/beta-fold hydrolase